MLTKSVVVLSVLTGDGDRDRIHHGLIIITITIITIVLVKTGNKYTVRLNSAKITIFVHDHLNLAHHLVVIVIKTAYDGCCACIAVGGLDKINTIRDHGAVDRPQTVHMTKAAVYGQGIVS